MARRTATMPADPMEGLKPRQVEILRLIRDWRREHGFSPTLQELGDALGITKVSVFEHVEALVARGLLVRQANKARSLRLTPAARLPDERPTVLPLVGRIAAGRPLETFEQSEAVDLETLFSSRYPVGVLEVTGDSMIDEHIRDGDLVVFEKRDNPRNGEVVVALVDGEETTLKKFYRERGRIRLQPAHPRYPPLYPEQVQIQGVVVGVIRRY